MEQGFRQSRAAGFGGIAAVLGVIRDGSQPKAPLPLAAELGGTGVVPGGAFARLGLAVGGELGRVIRRAVGFDERLQQRPPITPGLAGSAWSGSLTGWCTCPARP